MNVDLTGALAWALIHFLWQGTLIALAAGAASVILKRAGSTTRYALFCVALAAMAAAPVVTWLVIRSAPAGASQQLTPAPAASTAATASDNVPDRNPQPEWFQWLVGAWLAGVGILSMRSAGGWFVAQRLKWRQTWMAPEALQRMASRSAKRLAMTRVVRVLESALAEVPAVIGWLRPVILMPASAITSLTPEQIELLLAHELAHIRRHDYVVNLLQTAVENALFYHPAVWWVSSRIRMEREHCCDDLAVQACGNVVEYARTLATLERLRTRQAGLAVAADGGSLLHRIQRLVSRPRSSRVSPTAWVGALLPVAVVLIAVLSVRPKEARATAAEIAEVDRSAPREAESAKEPSEPEPEQTEAPPERAAQASDEKADAAGESTPESEGQPEPEPAVPREGFLGGLADAGYTNVSVDEIIALKDNGVDPRYIKEMKSAGLGIPAVRDLIHMHQQGVEPNFAAAMARSGLVRDLSFDTVVRLRQHGADGEDMGRIKALGFGPYAADEVIKLRDSGVTSKVFEALKEAGITQAGVREAIVVQQNGISAENIRSMKRQGFGNLSLEQIVKLRRAGVI